MPYELRDRPGSDGVEATSADVKIDTPGGTDERRVEVGGRQVEQLLEMLGKLAVSPHVYNTATLFQRSRTRRFHSNRKKAGVSGQIVRS